MPSSTQMLKQVRKAMTAVAQEPCTPTQTALLTLIDLYLNEMMLQDVSAFYPDYLAQGRSLLAKGLRLAASNSNALTTLRDNLTAESRYELFEAEIYKLNDGLAALIKTLDESRSAEHKDYLNRVTTWESRRYKRSLEAVPYSVQGKSLALTPDDLAAYLAKKFPAWKNIRVTKLQTMAGGFSKTTILFETEDDTNGPQAMVLRAEPALKMLLQDGCNVAQEFHALKVIHRAGLPVPEPLWLEVDRGLLGVPFLVSRMVAGVIVGNSSGAFSPQPDSVSQSVLSHLMQMHAIKIDASDPLVQQSQLREWTPYKTIRDTARYCAEGFLPELIQRGGFKITPNLTRALRWLEKNTPDCDEPPVVVHTDYGYHNILIDKQHVSSILDWELSRLGDPADDIIWTQANIAVYQMPEFLARYNKGTGREISPYRIAYARLAYSVFNNIVGQTTLHLIEHDDNAPIHVGIIAFKYMGILSSDFDQLIAAAEAAKGN